MSEGLGPLDSEACRAIVSCVSIGPGSLHTVRVNDTHIADTVTWKSHCIIDANYGGIWCDEELIAPLKPGDSWHVDKMINKGRCYNALDATRLQDVEQTKKRLRADGDIVN